MAEPRYADPRLRSPPDLRTSPLGRQAVDMSFKILVVGAPFVGKSCLVKQLIQGMFQEEHRPTIGVEFGSFCIDLGKNALVKLQIWDTCGQESYRAITTNYYRGAQGALLCYDVTKRDSFVVLSHWLHEIYSYCDNDVPVVLVGNKVDMEEKRTVSFLEGRTFAQDHGLEFLETSAKTAQNVTEAFIKLALQIYQQCARGTIVEKQYYQPDKKSNCCF